MLMQLLVGEKEYDEMICWHCEKEFEPKHLSSHKDLDGGSLVLCEWCGAENIGGEEMALIEMDKIKLPFFKKEDLTSGGIVTIESEIAEGGNFGQFIGAIKLPDGSLKRSGFNTTSISAMVARWGNDTAQWIGKELIFTIEDIINSKTKQVLKDCKIFRPVVE